MKWGGTNVERSGENKRAGDAHSTEFRGGWVGEVCHEGARNAKKNRK